MSKMEKFENYLKKIKSSQKIFIYALPSLLTAAIIYLNILPSQEEEFDLSTQKADQLKRDIKRKSPSILRKKIKKSEKKLLALKTQIEDNKDDLNYLYAKLTNLEISEFDETKWTLALDKILKKSLSLNIKIDHIKNSDSKKEETDNAILPEKYVEIAGSGNYENALKYLSFIENTRFLIDIKNIRFEKKSGEDKIDIKVNFTIYGIKL